MYRGTTYTDPKGMVYNLRYMPITVANDTTVPVQLEIVFLKEYAYPTAQGDQAFKVFPLPTAWALDGVGINDSLLNELPNSINNPSLKLRLEPEENYLFAIATLYPRPANFGGVRPMELFSPSSKEMRADCTRLKGQKSSPENPDILVLKLNFGGNCRIISCGQMLYHGR